MRWSATRSRTGGACANAADGASSARSSSTPARFAGARRKRRARLREKGYLAADTSQEIVNLQALREYLANYLSNCPDVRSDLMSMVRTLQPTSEGVPLEFYCFTRHFEWIPYEAFQSALTDRVLTLLPEFGLQAFQRPAGTDLHERH